MSAENRPLTSVRGFAALWVVAHHMVPATLGLSPQFLRLGYTAVDLFFVLSGLILAEVYTALRWHAVPMFLVKRACRIYPLHMAILSGFVLLAIRHYARANDLGQILNWQTVASYLLLQPYLRLSVPTNAPAWSAGVELACYLVFPLAIQLLRRGRSWFGALALLAVALALEHATLAAWQGAIGGTGAVLRGMGGFGLGMALWRTARVMTVGRLGASVAELAGLAGLLACVAINRPELVPLWAALLLLGLNFDRGLIAWLLRAEPCVWLGRISFSIYLVHAVLMSYGDKFLRHYGVPGAGVVPGTVRLGILTAVLLVVCTLTYRFIEQPGRRLPSLLLRRQAVRPRALAVG